MAPQPRGHQYGKQTPFPGYDPNVKPPGSATAKQTILRRGQRTSTPDASVGVTSIDQLLAIVEANRKHRLGVKPQPKHIEDLLRGLFGGG